MNELLIVAQLLNTKICHDIAGLIGAINNAIDYANNPDESIRNQAKTLLTNSSREAAKRLNFYRESYGVIRDENVNISLVKKFLEDFLNPDKFSVIINNPDKIDIISQLTLKFCLSMASIGSKALGLGGSIIFDFISTNTNQAIVTQMSISGKMIIKKEDIFDILKGNSTEINSSNINAYYAYLLSKELQKQIILDIKNDELTYKII